MRGTDVFEETSLEYNRLFWMRHINDNEATAALLTAFLFPAHFSVHFSGGDHCHSFYEQYGLDTS